MASAGELFGYEWLDTTTERPGAYMQVASCFYFFEGISVEEAVRLAGIRDAHPRGPVAEPEELVDFDTAIFDAGNGWTVVYQDNGWPDQYADTVAQADGVNRAVLVYWNVNALTEFSYWERGDCVVRFDFPADRTGSEPDRLLADMNETVGPLGQEAAGTVGAYYARMLALAERITGIHLGPDFLDRPAIIVGSAGEDYDGNGESFEAAVEPWTPSVGQGLPEEQLLGGIPMSLRPELREPLARRACQAAGIAHVEPIRSVLEALRTYKPLPAAMTSADEVLARFRSQSAASERAGAGPSAPDRLDPAVRAVFTAADLDNAMNLAPLLALTMTATGARGEDLIREVCAERGYR